MFKKFSIIFFVSLLISCSLVQNEKSGEPSIDISFSVFEGDERLAFPKIDFTSLSFINLKIEKTGLVSTVVSSKDFTSYDDFSSYFISLPYSNEYKFTAELVVSNAIYKGSCTKTISEDVSLITIPVNFYEFKEEGKGILDLIIDLPITSGIESYIVELVTEDSLVLIGKEVSSSSNNITFEIKEELNTGSYVGNLNIYSGADPDKTSPLYEGLESFYIFSDLISKDSIKIEGFNNNLVDEKSSIIDVTSGEFEVQHFFSDETLTLTVPEGVKVSKWIINNEIMKDGDTLVTDSSINYNIKNCNIINYSVLALHNGIISSSSGSINTLKVPVITEVSSDLTFPIFDNLNKEYLLTIKASVEDESLDYNCQWYKVRNGSYTLIKNSDSSLTPENSTLIANFPVPMESRLSQDYACKITVSLGNFTKSVYSDLINVSQTVATGLPNVIVDTNDVAIKDKVNWIDSTIKIEGSSDESQNFSEVKMGIKGRGNYSWNNSSTKKPYAIKLEKKQKILGLPKGKRWVLLSNYLDNSFIRNHIAFFISTKLNMDYTVKGGFVNLILNGEYRGLYWLGEAIKVDEKRVNIDEANDYLIELDSNYDETYKFKSDIKGLPYMIKNDDEMNEDKLNILKARINEIESKFYNEDKTIISPIVDNYSDYIDISSMAKSFIVNELMANGELKHPKSFYMTMSSDQILKAGPVWDYDWALLKDNTSYYVKYTLYYELLHKIPEFKETVKTLLNSLEQSEIENEINIVSEYLKTTESLDNIMYGVNHNPGNSTFDTNLDHQEYVKKILCKRLQSLKKDYK